jgi:hypothetical protein
VVVDVRQSPDSTDLIVVKQKLVTTGELHPSGAPVETRLDLRRRKALLSVFEPTDSQGGAGPGRARSKCQRHSLRDRSRVL